MKTLTYLNTHPAFNRFNTTLKDELKSAGIPVRVLKSAKVGTYSLNVPDDRYDDSFKLLLNVRIQTKYSSLLELLNKKRK